MKKLTLSIVIPVYNEEDHIIPCLEAISAQTVAPLEVIVVDNNCTDKTIQLAEQFTGVRVVKEARPGIVHARNAGFDAARGEVIGRIDADTRLPEYWVETALNHVRTHPNKLLTGGSYMYDFAFPRLLGWLQEHFAFTANKLIIGNYIAWGSNLVLTKKMWLEAKPMASLDTSIHEDIDLGICLNKLGYEVEYDRSRKVGIESRVFSAKRNTRKQHLDYLMMWPKTLYAHNMKRAWLGVVGAYFIYYALLPVTVFNRLLGYAQALRMLIMRT